MLVLDDVVARPTPSVVSGPPDPLSSQIPGERAWKRAAYLLLAVALAAGYLALTHLYWYPAHPGVDQNGYLVGGKMMADHGTTRLSPLDPDTREVDPYSFVGRMWFGTDFGKPTERYYPKYPIGLPLLVAGCWKVGHWVGGDEAARVAAFYISPVGMAAALVGAFLLMRQVFGSYAALLGTIALAMSPVTLSLANNPNSHGASFLFVCWGMFLLISWWRRGGWVRAMLAGLCLGYAVTVRYTEALLLFPLYPLQPPIEPGDYPILYKVLYGFRLGNLFSFAEAIDKAKYPRWYAVFFGWNLMTVIRFLPVGPIALAAFFRLRWRRWRSWLESALLLAGWAVPVGLLLWHNLAGFGTATGYDSTRESEGFRWEYFVRNWETMLRHMYGTGLFFLFPLGLIGQVLLCVRRPRLGWILLTWTLPSLLLYSFYYWAPDSSATGYLRFFLTIFPPLVLGAMWLLGEVAGPLLRPGSAGTQASAPERLEPGSRRQAWGAVARAALSAAFIATACFTLYKLNPPSDEARWPAAWREACNVRNGLVVALGCLAVAFAWRPGAAAAALAVALAAGIGAYTIVDALPAEAHQSFVTDLSARRILAQAPAGSVIFADDDLLHHLQFVGDYRVYSNRTFAAAGRGFFFRTVNPNDPTAPVLFQQERGQAIMERFKDKDRIHEQRAIIGRALAHGHRVFFAVPASFRATWEGSSGVLSRYVKDEYHFAWRTVTTWDVPSYTDAARPTDRRSSGGSRGNPMRSSGLGGPAGGLGGAGRSLLVGRWELLEIVTAPPPPPAPSPAQRRKSTAPSSSPSMARPATTQSVVVDDPRAE